MAKKLTEAVEPKMVTKTKTKHIAIIKDAVTGEEIERTEHARKTTEAKALMAYIRKTGKGGVVAEVAKETVTIGMTVEEFEKHATVIETPVAETEGK